MRIVTISFLIGSMISMYSHCFREQTIAVIIPSYNNATCYEANLDSVIGQNYSNYHVYYIDDCSTDETGRLVELYIQKHGLQDKITFFKNTYNRKALANIYKIVHMCDDQTLCILLDGDDSFANPDVLSVLNAIHSPEEVWFSYGQYINVPKEMAIAAGIPVLGYARETSKELIESRMFRKEGLWLWSGLRSFYAWLFKCIPLYDCILPEKPFKGKFFPTSYDNVLVYPMLEISGHRIKFISDIVLLRNVDTPLNDFKIHKDLQKICAKVLRKIPPYSRIDNPQLSQLSEIENVDILILNTADTQSCLNFLASLYARVSHIGTIFIISQCNNDSKLLLQKYPNVKIISAIPGDNCIPKLLQALDASSPYVLLASDSQELRKDLDLNECARFLAMTHAYGFYFSVNINAFGGLETSRALMPCEEIDYPLCAWHFKCNESLRSSIHTTTMALYCTSSVRSVLTTTYASTPLEVAQLWQDAPVPDNQVGLFFAQ